MFIFFNLKQLPFISKKKPSKTAESESTVYLHVVWSSSKHLYKNNRTENLYCGA